MAQITHYYSLYSERERCQYHLPNQIRVRDVKILAEAAHDDSALTALAHDVQVEDGAAGVEESRDGHRGQILRIEDGQSGLNVWTHAPEASGHEAARGVKAQSANAVPLYDT